MATSLTPLQQVRVEIQDTEAGLYILDDDTIQYFLDKHNGSVARASIDCAKSILFQLSMRSTEEKVDVLFINGSKAATAYRDALKLYISNPMLNPVMGSIRIYAGGISKSDMQTNDANQDNNIVKRIDKEYPADSFANPFGL